VTYGFTSGGWDWPMEGRGCPGHRREAKLVASPGHDAGKAIGNHSRDIDASCKRGSATATVAPALSLRHGRASSRPSTSFPDDTVSICGSMKDVDARTSPGTTAVNHSRDIDASCKRGSATATVAPALSLRHGGARRRSFASRRRPGHPRPSTSRGCMLQARSSDRVFQRPTTSPRGPRPADKGPGCLGHRREAKLVASPGHDAGDSLADTALKSQLAA
jgi:hypothetical protein